MGDTINNQDIIPNESNRDKTYLDEIVDATDDANYLFVKYIVVILCISIVVFSVTGNSIYQALIFLLDGVGIALTFLLAGGAIGFVFGIPKSLQNTLPANGSTTRFITNTSLEQISDWLTKIIVGLGLVEIREVFHLIKRLYNFFCTNVISGTNCHEWGLYLTSLALICALFGFLIFYIYTRVNLSSMFFKKGYDESKFKDEVAQNINSKMT